MLEVMDSDGNEEMVHQSAAAYASVYPQQQMVQRVSQTKTVQLVQSPQRATTAEQALAMGGRRLGLLPAGNFQTAFDTLQAAPAGGYANAGPAQQPQYAPQQQQPLYAPQQRQQQQQYAPQQQQQPQYAPQQVQQQQPQLTPQQYMQMQQFFQQLQRQPPS
jgi:hypothetical protein